MVVVNQKILSANEVLFGSLELGQGGLLRGDEGRKHALIAGNSWANPVVKVVESSFHDPWQSSLIENLIIDGNETGSGNRFVTGILLENVMHCMIRNVTIKNCEVGIHIRSYKGLWSECACLKHIRMENVKKGVVFTTTGPYKGYPNDPNKTYPGSEFCSAAFTSIEDVDIGLANYSDAVGIQVGGVQILTDPDPHGVDSYTTSVKPCDDVDPIDKNANPLLYATGITPYSSHIRARVRLGSLGGTGLKILNGKLYWAQAHLTVTKTGGSGGIGIDIQPHPVTNVKQDKAIWNNQFSTINNDVVIKGGFMLVVGPNIATPINPNNIVADIQTKTIP